MLYTLETENVIFIQMFKQFCFAGFEDNVPTQLVVYCPGSYNDKTIFKNSNVQHYN